MSTTNDSSNIRDAYEVLEVDETATDAQIWRAYKRVARRCHPDKNPTQTKEATELFQKLTDCVKQLTDPEKRNALNKKRKLNRERQLEKQSLNVRRSRLIDELNKREKECEKKTEKEQWPKRKRYRKNESPPRNPEKPNRGNGFVRLRTKNKVCADEVEDIFRPYGKIVRTMSTQDEDFVVKFKYFDDALKAVLAQKGRKDDFYWSVKLVDAEIEQECRMEFADDYEVFEASVLQRMANFE
ncbi:hypothetical protein ACOME3_005153 [Neoechinorhynchus agilis]